MINDLGLFMSRAIIGLGMAAHGAQKTFGWFEGPGLQGAAGFMEQLGFAPSETYAKVASYNEFVSGLLTAFGLGGPVGPSGIIAGMTVAAATVHKENGFFAAKNGYELPAVYTAGALALASSGFGAISLDRAIGWDENLRHPLATGLIVGAGIAGALAALAMRKPPQAAQSGQSS
jgi:putative oxidoreductase